jgi:hypothetical protein
MRREIFSLGLFLIFSLVFLSSALEEKIRPKYPILFNPDGKLEVEIWVNKGLNSNYFPGEEIQVFFRASKNCYVTIYDITPGDEVYILYPTPTRPDNFVFGGRIYRVPDYSESRVLKVGNVPGLEILQIVATTEKYPLPGWETEDYPQQEEEKKKEKLPWTHLVSRKPERLLQEIRDDLKRYPIYEWAGETCSFFIQEIGLLPPPYKLTVYSQPAGASVFIDGEYLGKTPFTSHNVPVGTHQLTLLKKGYYVFSEIIIISSSGETFREIKLEKIYY